MVAVPQAGVRIRDYEVWGRLSEGGMSEIWLAKHAVLCVPVVLKTLRQTSIDDPETRFERMLNEARMMARIGAPQVVRATDAGVHEGVGYVVQEYVDGLDLAELDESRRRALGLGLPLWFVCHAMHETCRALQASHRAGILHRDVKPSNLFGSFHGIQLGDFGIAIHSHDAKLPGEISGTFRFMAPEQLRGDALDRASDVWGAAATAFDLRYGRGPFDDVRGTLDPQTPPAFLYAQTASEAAFQHLVARMLRKDPAARPRDLGELARSFGALARAQQPGPDRAALSRLGKRRYRLGECEIEFIAGDIALARADGIVSSAHDHMKMRSGVGDALRIRGGDSIEEEAMRGGERALGAVVATCAGSLEAKHVLHAVSAWNEVSCVGRAAHRTFLLADELGLRSLAIPALGTGASRVTIEMCASAIASALRAHILLGGTRLRQVQFVLRDEATLDVFRAVAEDALRADDDVPLFDLGLPIEGAPVSPDGVTYVHPSKPE
jgi:eukaryotic-like serine/threonine-protein kinase